MFTLTFTVSPQLTDTLKRLQKTPQLFGAALYAEASSIMDDACARAPRDVGGLVASAYIRPPARKETPAVEIGFGSEWAAYIHERMDLHHDAGEAKYMQRALDAGAQELYDRCGQHVAAWIEKGKDVEVSSRYPTTAPAVGREHSTRSLKRASLRRRRR